MWRKFQGEWDISTFFTPSLRRWGSGMATAEITRNANTNTPMAIKRSGATLPIVVLSETSPTSIPTKSGVRVPASELREPPACTIWLPLLPPPPSMLSIGLTTVLSIHTQNPQMNAPRRYMMKLRVTTCSPTLKRPASAPTFPESHWNTRPIKPTAIAQRAVFL